MQTISTILTVLIAVGAIWAAFASTRQAQYSRRLASAAERNVGEQMRSFKEQNERARISFEMDMLFRLEDRFHTQRLVNTRRRVANYIKENFFTPDGGMLEVSHVHPDSLQLLTFFEEVGHLRSMGSCGTNRCGIGLGVVFETTGLCTSQPSRRYAKRRKIRR